MNSVFVGNFKEYIDCDQLVLTLRSSKGDRRTTDNPYGNALEPDEEILKAKSQMKKQWEDAGYMSSDSVEWINFYPGTHFDQDIVKNFSDLVNADPYNIWISSMTPGKCVPWHWDIIKDYQTYKDDTRMVRYTFFIDKPQIGKVFILNDETFHMIEQGSVYKWTKWDEWHLGFNCGHDQKFLFHFIGFSR
jgi:hypothetical protein